ncbi:hypothetical protein MBANPS3_003928 [Mucor bainieri]
MQNLPVEILMKILDHLPRFTKLQCAVVCKSWCATALSVLNSSIDLKNRSDTLILFEKLCQVNSTIQGSTIRHLSLSHNSRISEAVVNKVVFVRILSECTNLRTLEFKDVTFDLAYLEHIIRYRDSLHLDHLQCIKTQYSDSTNYLLVNCTFDFANDLNMYLDHFKALKTLSLKFSCTVYINSLLSACPQLESLELLYTTSSSRLRIYNDNTTTQQSNAPFQLKYLDISAHHITQELFEYLHDRASNLFQLTVNHHALLENSLAIDNAFNTPLVVDTVLPIQRIIFQENFNVSDNVIFGLNENFRDLRVVDFRACDFNGVMDANRNLSLNFDQLELDCLSIDFSSIFGYNTPVTSISLAIESQEHENTMFYNRTSKWSPAHLFTRNDNTRYANSTLQRNRLLSAKTSVITIKVQSLHQLHMHGEGNSRRAFSQVISLQ